MYAKIEFSAFPPSSPEAAARLAAGFLPLQDRTRLGCRFAEFLMLSAPLTNLLKELEESSDASVQAGKLKRFGRALLEAPQEASDLLAVLAGMDKAGPREERLSHLLGAALDEARMARENGHQRGALFIDTLEAQLARLVADGLTFTGSLAVSGSWVRAGLTPPDCLALRQDGLNEALEDGDPSELERLLDDLTGTLAKEAGGSVSAMHAMFAEMLPTVPPEARQALVRIAVARPPEVYADLGCTWLLDPNEPLRSGAVAGLADRLAAGRLSAQVVARLAILRSWLADAALRGRLDDLIRDAMRTGIGNLAIGPEPKLHRIVASLADGSGAQSLAAAVQTGGVRSVAVVLLKQGFGVKDAYVLPCSSATEQRGILDSITREIEARDVPRAYLAQAIGLALAEGLEAGITPVPGLVDVVRTCGFDALRPIPASVAALLALADPEGRVAGLSAQMRGHLINASEGWEDDYPMLASWFEDSDATISALESTRSAAGLTRAMWSVLEPRRSHWARVIARNALLLRAAGMDDAEAFVAVAAAMEAGRDLKKIPVMQFICDLSIEVWLGRREGFDRDFDPEFDPKLPHLAQERPAPRMLRDAPAEKKGELAKMLRPAGLSEPWLDGFLTGICTAPLFVSPPEWLSPLLHLLGGALKTDARMQRFVELAILRYNATLPKLRAQDAPLIPADVLLMPIWADGYLTAWESKKPNWPAKTLGPKGKAMRKVLEQATEGKIEKTAFIATLPAWLRHRFAEQKM